jgi:hypothetical protein
MADNYFLTSNRRHNERIRVRLNGRFFIKGLNIEYEDCVMINVSRTGIAFKTTTPSFNLKEPKTGFAMRTEIANFDVSGLLNRVMYVDVFPPLGSMETITFYGEIKRVAKQKDRIYFAVHFSKIIDNPTFLRLTRGIPPSNSNSKKYIAAPAADAEAAASED